MARPVRVADEPLLLAVGPAKALLWREETGFVAVDPREVVTAPSARAAAEHLCRLMGAKGGEG